jgi:hypothetical protein
MSSAPRPVPPSRRPRGLLSTAALTRRLGALREGESAAVTSASPPTPEAHALCALLTILACLLGAGLVLCFVLYDEPGDGP